MCVYQMLLIERTLLVVYHSVALPREPAIAIGKKSHSPGHRSSSHDQWPLFDKVRIVKPFRSTMNLAAAYKLIIFSSFRAAYIFDFFTLWKGVGWRSVFPGLPFFDQTLFSHSILFSITCTSVTGGIMMNRRQLCVNIITRVMSKRETW